MGRETRLFKKRRTAQPFRSQPILHQIADKIETGQVVLRQGQDELTLSIPTNLILEVQVEDEDKKGKGVQHSLEIELNGLMMMARAVPLELG